MSIKEKMKEKNNESRIKKQRIIAICMAIIALIFWAGNFIVSRGIGDEYSPIVTSFFRWLFTMICFTPLALPKVKKEWKYVREQKGLVILYGFFGVGVFALLVYVAGVTTSATNMSLIVSSSPIFALLILRIFLKEKIGKVKIFGMTIVIIGVVMLILKGDISTLTEMKFVTGDYLMIICAVLWGMYMVLNKCKSPNVSNVTFVFCGFTLAFLMNIPLFAIEVFNNGFPQIDLMGILCFLYISILNSIAGFILWSRATEVLGTSYLAVIYNLLPVFSCILAVIILNETIYPIQIISMVIVLGGILIAQRGSSKEIKSS